MSAQKPSVSIPSLYYRRLPAAGEFPVRDRYRQLFITIYDSPRHSVLCFCFVRVGAIPFVVTAGVRVYETSAANWIAGLR